MRYTVTAERGAGPVWVFQCVEYPGAISESKRLTDAHELMRETIGFVADVDEDSVEIDLQPVLSDEAETLMHRAQEHRQHSEQLAEQASEEYRKAARTLQGDGITLRDIGALLGVSYQRAHQLVS